MFIHEIIDKILVIGTETYRLIQEYGYDGYDDGIDSIIPLIMDSPNYSGEPCIIVIPCKFIITEPYQRLIDAVNSKEMTKLDTLLKQINKDASKNLITREQAVYLKYLIKNRNVNDQQIGKIKRVKIRAEVWDNFHYQFLDEKNNPITNTCIGFVSPFLPTSDGNDLILEIDVETGQILNWKKTDLGREKSEPDLT